MDVHQHEVLQSQYQQSPPTDPRRISFKEDQAKIFHEWCSPQGRRVSLRDLDKVARNSNTFNPSSAGVNGIHAYLQDIDFHLGMLDQATPHDKIYLIRVTSSLEVRSFLDRQPEEVKANSQWLREALIREFAGPESEQGITVAMDVKQGRQETPQAYCNRLRKAYFGSRNEPEMEEDLNFKKLFLRNLHPSIRRYLGLIADPLTMKIQQLRDLAIKAYNQQKAATEKHTTTILSVVTQNSDLVLEGDHPPMQTRNRNEGWRPPPPSRNYTFGTKERPRDQTDRWEKPRYFDRPKPEQHTHWMAKSYRSPATAGSSSPPKC